MRGGVCFAQKGKQLDDERQKLDASLQEKQKELLEAEARVSELQGTVQTHLVELDSAAKQKVDLLAQLEQLKSAQEVRQSAPSRGQLPCRSVKWTVLTVGCLY